MGTKTVRMEPEDERLLDKLRKQTGWTTSDVLKRGLRLLEESLSDRPTTLAYDIYKTLDLGPGGYAAGPATETRQTVKRILTEKHKR